MKKLMFRGYIINGFTRNGFWQAVIISGIMFGIFHLDPFRLLPASLLGIYLGYLTLKTNSIFPAMLAHFINNSLAIIFSNYSDRIPFLDKIVSSGNIPLWVSFLGLAIALILLQLFHKFNSNDLIENTVT